MGRPEASRLAMTLARLRRAGAGLALACVAAIGVVEWVLAILRPEQGLAATLQIVAPHLAMVGLVLGAMAVALGRGARRLVIPGVLLVIVTFRFGGEWLSGPAPSAPQTASRLTIATWNLEVLARPAGETIAMLRTHPADVVALQELEPVTAKAIATDPEIARLYPYQRLSPRSDVLGQGVLSSLPIEDATFSPSPAVQVVELRADGGPIVVVNVHPMRGQIGGFDRDGIPFAIDVRRRNDDLAAIRRLVDDRERSGASVILLGDFNTASSEPAYDRLAAGLRDVHAEVGEGPGWTWRPIRLESLGIGLIRIDHVLVSREIQPMSISEACPAVGDHCLVRAEIAVPQPY